MLLLWNARKDLGIKQVYKPIGSLQQGYRSYLLLLGVVEDPLVQLLVVDSLLLQGHRPRNLPKKVSFRSQQILILMLPWGWAHLHFTPLMRNDPDVESETQYMDIVIFVKPTAVEVNPGGSKEKKEKIPHQRMIIQKFIKEMDLTLPHSQRFALEEQAIRVKSKISNLSTGDEMEKYLQRSVATIATTLLVSTRRRQWSLVQRASLHQQ